MPNFKTYHIATQAGQCGSGGRVDTQSNRTDREPRSRLRQVVKKQFSLSTNGAGATRHPQTKEQHNVTPYTNVNSKQVTDLGVEL